MKNKRKILISSIIFLGAITLVIGFQNCGGSFKSSNPIQQVSSVASLLDIPLESQPQAAAYQVQASGTPETGPTIVGEPAACHRVIGSSMNWLNTSQASQKNEFELWRIFQAGDCQVSVYGLSLWRMTMWPLSRPLGDAHNWIATGDSPIYCDSLGVDKKTGKYQVSLKYFDDMATSE